MRLLRTREFEINNKVHIKATLFVNNINYITLKYNIMLRKCKLNKET